MNPEKISNQTETSFDTADEPLTWVEHVKRAKELIQQKITGEKTPSENYLLSEHLDPTEKKAWKNLIKDWDKDINVNVSSELGNLMEKYIKDPNYQFGIHRSSDIDGAKYQTDATLHSIMKNGLVVLGDSMSGSIRNNADPSKTVSFCNNIMDAIIFTKSSRNGSTGAILVAIPSEFVNKDGELLPGKAEEVYNYDEIGNAHIKPEYMLGFAPNLGKGSTVNFVSREKILNK